MEEFLIKGMHHITALADDAISNVNFYTGILGLRMVKKTINFDDPGVYHLYYGNETGSPGTIMTFFPYKGLPNGRHGNGQTTTTSFSVSEKSLDFWINRLENFGIKASKPESRFKETFINFYDVHGLEIEIVFNNQDDRKGFTYGHIPIEHSIKGFYGIVLSEDNYEKTSKFISDFLDYEYYGEYDNIYRFAIGKKNYEFINIEHKPGFKKGLSGSGTIHHVAFATNNSSSQLKARERLLSAGTDVTPVIDRQYFHSIYFHEPGGVLFEIATIPPGFLIDEDAAHLGEDLKLPSWLNSKKDIIERNLGPIQVPTFNAINK